MTVRLYNKLFVSILLITFILTGCSSTTTNKHIDPYLSVNIENNDSTQQFRVTSYTNLPEGMILNVNVTSNNEDKYESSQDVIVKNGSINSDWFTDEKNPQKKLNSGNYIVEIKSASWTQQPDNVLKYTGKQGEFLTGDNVKKNEQNENVFTFKSSAKVDGQNFIIQHIEKDKKVKITAKQITVAFTALGFSFTSTKVGDKPCLEGISPDKKFNIFLVGDPNNLFNVSEQTKHYSGDLNDQYIRLLLAKALPEWTDSDDWVTKFNDEIFPQLDINDPNLTIFYRDKAVTLTASKTMVVESLIITPIEQ